MNLDPEGRDLVIRTILGEAAGESDFGKLAVAHVIRNRLSDGGYGASAKDVVLAPKQFTPWMTRSKELLSYSPEDPKYQTVGRMVDAVWSGQVPDITKGATHFANVKTADPVNQQGWIAEMQSASPLKIGAHTFGKPASAPGRQAATRSMAGLTFEELPDAPAAAGAITFEELPDEKPVDPNARLAQAHSGAVMAGGARATPEDLGQRMELVTKERQQFGTGPAGAAARGLVRGPFLGFGDEIAGGLNAAGSYVGNLIDKGPSGAAQEAGRAYTNTVEADRVLRQLDEANNPIARAAGDIGGSIAAPVGPLGKVVTTGKGLVPAVQRASEIGAKAGVIGAIQGAGNAEGGIGERIEGAQGGALLGTLLGVGSRPIAGAVSAATKPVRDLVNTARGALRPEAEAERRVAVALARDVGQGRAGLAGQALDDALAAGKPVVAADVGGETTRALARSAANTSPEGRAALEAAAGERFITQATRIAEAVGDLSMGGAKGSIDALKSAVTPGYRRAIIEGDKPLMSPELERLISSPAVVAAMKAATTRGKDRAAMEGFGGFNPGVKITDDGLVEFAKGKGGVPTFPNLQFWDYTKRALDDGARAAFRAGRNDEGSVLSGLAKQLRGELDELVPSYRGARSQAAAAFGAEDAFEAGQKLVSMSLKGSALDKMRGEVARMGQQERTLFREGFIADLKNKLNSLPENRDVTKAIFNSKASRDQMELALGKGGAAKLEAELHTEKIMDALRPAIRGNSSTARQLAELGLAGGIGSAYSGYTGDLSGGSIVGALTFAARKGSAKIDQRVSRKVGEILASDDPDKIRRLAQVAAQSPQYMSALRNLSTKLTGIGGGENAPAGARVFGGPVGAAASDSQP